MLPQISHVAPQNGTAPDTLGLIRGRLNGQLHVRTKSSRSSWVDPADITDKRLSAMFQKKRPRN
jgi:hypothetical protein